MAPMTTHTAPITIRRATPADADVLTRLAGLDSARPLTGHVLLAEVEGRAVAAIAVADGRVIADPFERTTVAVAMLRIRAHHLAAERHGGRRRRTVRRLLRAAA